MIVVNGYWVIKWRSKSSGKYLFNIRIIFLSSCLMTRYDNNTFSTWLLLALLYIIISAPHWILGQSYFYMQYIINVVYINISWSNSDGNFFHEDNFTKMRNEMMFPNTVLVLNLTISTGWNGLPLIAMKITCSGKPGIRTQVSVSVMRVSPSDRDNMDMSCVEHYSCKYTRH